MLQKKSLSLCTQITFVAYSLASLPPFLSLRLHIADLQLGVAIKGATSFSCQEKLQVAGEGYTAVEVGQVSFFALAPNTSLRSCNL